MRCFRFLSTVLALWFLALSPAHAQSPTVHVKDAWTQLDFPAGAEVRVDSILSKGAELRDYGTEILGVPPRPVPLTVKVLSSPEDMAAASPDGAPPPDYAAGVAYPEQRLILISMRAPYTHVAVDVAQTWRHEYMHAALRDATEGAPLPRWFHEGVAIFASGERIAERRDTLLNALALGGIIPLDELDRHFRDGAPDVDLAYAQSADVIRLLTRPEDRPRFHRMLARIREGQAFGSALSDAYGKDLRGLSVEWQKDLAASKGEAYGALVATGSGLWLVGALLLGYAWWQKRTRGQLTLARWRAETELEARNRARLEAWFASERGQEPDDRDDLHDDGEGAPFQSAMDLLEADERGAGGHGADGTHGAHGDRPRDPSLPYVERDGAWHVLH